MLFFMSITFRRTPSPLLKEMYELISIKESTVWSFCQMELIEWKTTDQLYMFDSTLVITIQQNGWNGKEQNEI